MISYLCIIGFFAVVAWASDEYKAKKGKRQEMLEREERGKQEDAE